MTRGVAPHRDRARNRDRRKGRTVASVRRSRVSQHLHGRPPTAAEGARNQGAAQSLSVARFHAAGQLSRRGRARTANGAATGMRVLASLFR